jgi:hypothetical protein
MKLVRENIIFEKFVEKSDSVKDMGIGKEGIFKNLEKRGVRMWFGWGQREGQESEGEIEKKKVIENIFEIEKLINKLIEIGFKSNDMSISHADGIKVKTIMVASSNWAIFHCVTKEDAEIMMDVIRKFSIWQYDNLHLTDGETTIYVSSKYPEWLINIIENRKKYKNIK